MNLRKLPIREINWKINNKYKIGPLSKPGYEHRRDRYLKFFFQHSGYKKKTFL